MRELVDGIFTWPWFSERHGYDFNGYLVRHPAGNVCIDPVQPDEASLEAITRAGVASVVLTNRNHVRQANLIRSRTGARVAIHAADAAYARDQGAIIDGTLDDERIGPFSVVPMPGKSPGEIALHWPERRILVLGDAAVGNPPGSLSLLPEKVIDDLARLRQSLRDVASLNPDIVLVGDGHPILSSGGAALRALVASFPT